MRLSISNIGWVSESDEQIYKIMKKLDFRGLEIAPTEYSLKVRMTNQKMQKSGVKA